MADCGADCNVALKVVSILECHNTQSRISEKPHECLPCEYSSKGCDDEERVATGGPLEFVQGCSWAGQVLDECQGEDVAEDAIPERQVVNVGQYEVYVAEGP